jgi:hypothetical protein
LPKVQHIIVLLIAKLLASATQKKRESDQFPKKISNPSSSETMHRGV